MDEIRAAIRADVDGIAAEVSAQAVQQVQARAAELFPPRAAPGTAEWEAEQADPVGLTRKEIAWQLVCLRIALKSGVDPAGFLVGLRRWGATWEVIGAAAGMSRQAAHERWSKQVAAILDPYGTGEIGAAVGGV